MKIRLRPIEPCCWLLVTGCWSNKENQDEYNHKMNKPHDEIRKLTAVMFTGIVGYTALMYRDYKDFYSDEM